MNVGANTKKFREDMNMSQAQLAKAVNVTAAMISQIETGSKIPSIALAGRLADQFNCTLDELAYTQEVKK